MKHDYWSLDRFLNERKNKNNKNFNMHHTFVFLRGMLVGERCRGEEKKNNK
jgi:hypothetical protein